MLTNEEATIVLTKMSEFDHIFEIVSATWGEPFLHENYIYYFDGFTAYIPRPLGEEDLTILDYVVRRHNPQRIIITSGKEPPDLPGYEREVWPIEGYRDELRILRPQPSKKMKKALNHIEREGIEVIVRSDGYYAADTLKLLVQTHEEFAISWRNTIWYALYPKIERIRLVELRKDGEIIGVQIVYDNRPRYVCFAEMGYRKDVKRASDMVYAAAFSLFGDVEILSLGGSRTPSIFSYKLEFFKDPALYCCQDYYWTKYTRKGLEDVKPWYVMMHEQREG